MKKAKILLCISCSFALMMSMVCIKVSAFTFKDGDFGFELDTFEKTSALVEYTGNSQTVNVPSGYSTYKLKKIKSSAFSGNTTAQIINLPTTVTTLDAEAFANCASLTTFTVMSNISNYGKGLFANCSSLQSAYILSDKTDLPDNTFQNCSALNKVELSPSISSLGSKSFYGCTSLTNASFLSQISQIGDFTFYNSGLEAITIPDTITAVPAYSFAECQNLSRVDIPATVTSIAPTAFYNDPNLNLGVYYGSAGYEYAVEQNIPYVLLDGVKLGDANGDGSVNINDVTSIQRHLAELEILEGIYLHAADANQDGTVDIADATVIQMYLAEYEMEYPIGEVMTQ